MILEPSYFPILRHKKLSNCGAKMMINIAFLVMIMFITMIFSKDNDITLYFKFNNHKWGYPIKAYLLQQTFFMTDISKDGTVQPKDLGPAEVARYFAHRQTNS